MAAQNQSTGISSGQLKKSNVPQGVHQIEVLDFTWVNQSVYAISEVTFLQYCNSDSLKIILDAA
jgi:hypothetical protein